MSCRGCASIWNFASNQRGGVRNSPMCSSRASASIRRGFTNSGVKFEPNPSLNWGFSATQLRLRLKVGIFVLHHCAAGGLGKFKKKEWRVLCKYQRHRSVKEKNATNVKYGWVSNELMEKKLYRVGFDWSLPKHGRP